MFNLRIFALTLFVLVALESYSESAILSCGKFDKWLDILTGKVSSKSSNADFSLDNINLAIGKWTAKDSKYASKIPPKLISITNIKLENCSKKIEDFLEPELTKNGDGKTFDKKYIQFYGKMQFNLCLQDMEFKRAKFAVQKMDKSKWIPWYDAMKDAQNIGQDMKGPSEKLANYLKSYVPQIDNGSPEEQSSKVDAEIKSMANAICPYVTKKVLKGEIEPSNIDYLSEKRATIKADPEAPIWSNSKIICENEKLQNELAKSVANFITSKLNSVQMKDENLSNLKDSKLISDILFPTDGKKTTSNTRMGNPMEMIEKLSQLPGDKQQEAKGILELRNVDWREYSCDLMKIIKLEQLQRKYKDNQVLSKYIDSMSALKYNVCEQMNRWFVANLATQAKPVQLGALNELLDIIAKYRDTSNESQLMDIKVGYGKGVRQFLNRYVSLDLYVESRDYPYQKNMFNYFNSEEDKKELTQMHSKITADKVRKYHKEIMDKFCENILKYLPMAQFNLMDSLLAIQTDEKLGDVTLRMLGYTNICNYINERSAISDLLNALSLK